MTSNFFYEFFSNQGMILQPPSTSRQAA